MATSTGTEDVQIFDVWEALKQGTVGRNDMATGALSYVAIFDTLPKQGELSVHQHPDSDQILFVLKGECTTRGLEGGEVLTPQEGVLIPAGSYYGFANTGEGDLKFLSMRTESTGGRHIRYVADEASGVSITIPHSRFGADPEKGSAEVYVLDHRTIAVSPVLIPEWNRSCVLRSSCVYASVDDDVVIELPQRVAGWYELSELHPGGYRVVSTPGTRGVLIELPFPRKGERVEAAAAGPQRPRADAGHVASLYLHASDLPCRHMSGGGGGGGGGFDSCTEIGEEIRRLRDEIRHDVRVEVRAARREIERAREEVARARVEVSGAKASATTEGNR